LLSIYLGTNAIGAETTMLKLEGYTLRCEKKGSGDIPFDQCYASIHSRLYLIEKHLGKSEAAERYYALAAKEWTRTYTASGQTAPTPEKMREQIEGVDAHLPLPSWRASGEATH
jgi:hypothetical protein